MYKRGLLATTILLLMLITGCSSIPLASLDEDKVRKTFSPPADGLAGLYIYRNSYIGGALKKYLYIDGELFGESGPMTYFYREIAPGEHILSTESQFSNNDITIQAKANENLFVRQYITLGLFAGGANFELVDEDEGMKGVLECKLAKELSSPLLID